MRYPLPNNVMNQSEDISLHWNEKVKLNRIVDPLGLRGLRVHQSLFFPGFNTQTQRAYYYSFLTWVWKKIEENGLGPSFIKNFEKLMVLTTTFFHPDNQLVTKGIFSKDFAKKFLKNNNSFSLKDFHLLGSGDYEGYGNNRYKMPISNMYIMWEEKNKEIFTPLAMKLIKAFDKKINFGMKYLKKENFDKNDLQKLKAINVGSLNDNEDEKDLLRKIFFGFITKLDKNCDINEDEYKQFINNKGIRLNFDLNVKLGEEDIFGTQDIGEFESKQDEKRAYERVISRRASLFLLLKVIENCHIKDERFDKITNLRNAVFYKQTKINDSIKEINFGELEQIRKYWELYFHNIYFTFCMEWLLEKIVILLEKYPFGIRIDKLIKEIDFEKINQKFKENDLSIEDIENNIRTLKNTDLNSEINEFNSFEKLTGHNNSVEEKLYHLIILLLLLKKKINQF